MSSGEFSIGEHFFSCKGERVWGIWPLRRCEGWTSGCEGGGSLRVWHVWKAVVCRLRHYSSVSNVCSGLWMARLGLAEFYRDRFIFTFMKFYMVLWSKASKYRKLNLDKPFWNILQRYEIFYQLLEIISDDFRIILYLYDNFSYRWKSMKFLFVNFLYCHLFCIANNTIWNMKVSQPTPPKQQSLKASKIWANKSMKFHF